MFFSSGALRLLHDAFIFASKNLLKMKKLFLSICLLLCSAGLRAQGAATLVVELRDGQQIAFSLQQQPVVSFEASTLSIAATDRSISVELDEVEQIHFGQTATGINDASVTTVFRQTSRHTIEIAHPAATTVALFDAAGRSYPTSIRTTGGHTVIDLRQLPAGTCIVRVGRQTFKLTH